MFPVLSNSNEHQEIKYKLNTLHTLQLDCRNILQNCFSRHFKPAPNLTFACYLNNFCVSLIRSNEA